MKMESPPPNLDMDSDPIIIGMEASPPAAAHRCGHAMNTASTKITLLMTTILMSCQKEHPSAYPVLYSILSTAGTAVLVYLLLASLWWIQYLLTCSLHKTDLVADLREKFRRWVDRISGTRQ
jgi:hypothetical protein